MWVISIWEVYWKYLDNTPESQIKKGLRREPEAPKIRKLPFLSSATLRFKLAYSLEYLARKLRQDGKVGGIHTGRFLPLTGFVIFIGRANRRVIHVALFARIALDADFDATMISDIVPVQAA